MKNAKIHLKYLFEVSMIVTLITFLLSYITAYLFGLNGFDLMEIAMMSLLPAIYSLVISIIVMSIMINKYRSDLYKKEIVPLKRIWSVLAVFASSVILLLTMDTAFFFLIDKSIPHGFADTILQSLPDNPDFRNNYQKIREMPYMVQNAIFIAGATLIGSLISVLFLKKEYS